MDWYLKVLKNYVGFSGRARRKEYWMFVLFNVIFGVAAMILDNVLGLASKELGYGPIYGIYALVMILPSLAVAARRLHDIGKSGWWQLIALIPIIGIIMLIVWYVREGETGSNIYGSDPKGAEGMAIAAA
jgi:uncharacterized membrane protein YhaH (DUF805 family)